jgi:hypothetical protein
MAVFVLLAFLHSSAHAVDAMAVPSTTKLHTSASVVDLGTPVTLTAEVLFAGPVRHGSILFCDASAVRCQGLAVLGSAQLTSRGRATINLTLGAGSYSIKAVFQGTPRTAPPVSGSTSIAQTLIVKRMTKSVRKGNSHP